MHWRAKAVVVWSLIGLGGAGIVDRHQRTIERRDGDVARGGENAIAHQAREADNGAHGGKSAKDLGADRIFGQSHTASLTRQRRQCDLRGFKTA